MHLQAYLSILRRYWLLVLLPPLIAGGVSLALALGRAPGYQASALLILTRTPLAAPGSTPLPTLDDGATWTSVEYILDDLPFVLGSAAFASDVHATLAAEGYEVDTETIRGSLRPEVSHRSVALSAVAASPETASAILRGAITTLADGGLKYWGRTPGGLQVAVLDPPGAAVPTSGLRSLARDVGLRVALALAAGVGLAFLLHALDDRLRNPLQAEQWVGVRVIGVIPKE